MTLATVARQQRSHKKGAEDRSRPASCGLVVVGRNGAEDPIKGAAMIAVVVDRASPGVRRGGGGVRGEARALIVARRAAPCVRFLLM